MNLREFIQSEILNTLSEDYDLDQTFNDAEPVEEGVMSELDILAKEAKDLKSFVKIVFKEFDNLPKNNETLKWLKGIYNDSKNESVNEAQKKLPKFKNIPSWVKYVAQHSDGEWFFYEETPTMIRFKSGGGAWNQDGNQIYAGVKTDGKDWDKAPTYYNVKNGKITESVNEAKKDIYDKFLDNPSSPKGRAKSLILKFTKQYGDDASSMAVDRFAKQNNLKPEEKYILKYITKNDIKISSQSGGPDFSAVSEEQIDEKLITFSNRAPYGQIVFMAGGAGSGKGFAIENFIDSAGFKVRDVDEMKKAVGKLDQLGKFSVDKWYKKYGNKLSTKPPKNNPKGMSDREHIEEFVLGKGMSISDIASDLKNPNNVMSLHIIVDAMGLKDKWLINMLKGKSNKETLPNILFDITAKKVASITDVINPLINAGYDSKNIHLIWVLKNYYAAVEANRDRDRVVPDDILLLTHEGAAKTMWSVLTKVLPKGLNGRIDVILNNNKFTAFFVDKNGEKIKVDPNQQNKLEKAQPVVKGFKSLPIKQQGGGIVPEEYWNKELKNWILTNAPKTIDLSQDLEK